LWSIVILIIGLFFGSFINVVAHRFKANFKSIFLGRSICPKCKKTLLWYDLIPIFSYIFLQGRCRFCKKTISWHYLAVELLTGLIFLAIFQYYGFDGRSLLLFLFTIPLMIILASDLKDNIIPDVFLGASFIIILFWRLTMPTFWQDVLIAVLAASIFFFFLALVSKGSWMGWGDVKLVAVLGLWLAYPKIIVGLFLAFLLGSIVGIGLLAVKKKKWKDTVPFGPFLIIGCFLAFFWADILIKWYLGI